MIVDTLVFIVGRNNLILFEKFLHGFCLFSCGDVLDGLLYGRVVNASSFIAKRSEACRVFQLAPEVLDEVLEGVCIAVNLQKGVPVLPVGGYGVEFSVLSDLRIPLPESVPSCQG